VSRKILKNNAILLLGSNIDPGYNIQLALELLHTLLQINEMSHQWLTEAFGSRGPDFLNMAVEVETDLDYEQIKTEVISFIETKLNRIRTFDKYASRTIDIDIIIFNGALIDPNIWKRLFIALPVSEIKPGLINNLTGLTLGETVEILKSSAKAELYK
jgi:2-amino-4-hydroxy-6-hydroxymethyldihydropteridine diphosphokinase